MIQKELLFRDGRFLQRPTGVQRKRAMETSAKKDVTSTAIVGEKPILPGTKLPPPALDTTNVPEDLQKAWINYMVHGFKNNEEMFKRTLHAFMKPYHLTIWMYGALFLVGIGLFVTAAVMGLNKGNSVAAIVFAGLGAGAFLAFFIRQPVQALEENLEFITWLGVAFNTYWTRVMYMMDMKTIQADLKAADDDYRASVERLITKHAELRGKRPGGELGSKEPGTK
jgi:hypothetical protein